MYREMQSVESFCAYVITITVLNYLTTISISGQSQSEFHHNQGLLFRYWLLECILY